MKLSSRARHSVRLVLEISRCANSSKPVGLSEISRVTGLSRKFLEQLAIALKSHSLIKGVCGRNGGYFLARPAEEITIGNVITSAVGPVILTNCIEESSMCISAEFCECRLVWLLLRERINEVLNEYTMADLSDKTWFRSIRKQIEDLDPLNPNSRIAAGEQ